MHIYMGSSLGAVAVCSCSSTSDSALEHRLSGIATTPLHGEARVYRLVDLIVEASCATKNINAPSPLHRSGRSVMLRLFSPL